MSDETTREGCPLVLALDTSSRATSIAIAKGDRVIESFIASESEVRSEKLWDDIESLLAQIGATIQDIDLYAVSVGPGGFTGLRVGIAAVKGFALAADKPAVGVTSLEAAAFGSNKFHLVSAMVNAYKSEVYSQLFSFDEDGVPVAETDPFVSTIVEAVERVGQINDIVFAGDGALASAEIIKLVAGERFSDEGSGDEPGWRIKVSADQAARSIARLAYKKYIRGESDTARSLRACYVRPAEAEIKLSLGLLGSKIRRSISRQQQ
jgi:tRNA threonylcarbamoyladenosine biosynthesis protein TsaB